MPEIHSSKQQGVAMLTLVLLLLVIASMAASGYLFYLRQQDSQSLELKLNTFSASVDEKLKSTAAAQKAIVQLEKNIDVATAIQERSLNEFKAQQLQIAQRLGKIEANSSKDWLLSEIGYLLKMANHRMLMKDDVQGAIALLNSADQIIASIPVDDAGLNKVRTAIKKDISQLELHQLVDVAGTYAELSALTEVVWGMDILPLEAEVLEKEPMDKEFQQDSSNDLMSKINKTFKQYFTIRHYNEKDLQATLTLQERELLRKILLLKIEQAKTALLRSNQTVYLSSLESIEGNLNKHFASEDYRTDLAKLKLEKLKDVVLDKPLPDSSKSQQALKRYLSSSKTEQE